MKKFYTAKKDVVFKNTLFSGKDLDLSSEFLSRILNKKVEVIRIENTELPVDKVMEKKKIVDVLAKIDGGYCHIELNANNMPFLHERNFSYFASIYVQRVKLGEKYEESASFMHIDLTYGMKKGKEEIYKYYVQTEGKDRYIRNFEIIEFNMDKIMEYWYNEDAEKISKFKPLIMLDLDIEGLEKLGDDAFMEKFKENIEKLNSDQEFVSWMSWEEDMKKVHETELLYAKEEGVVQGKEEGIKTSKQEIARNLLSKNYSTNEISEITGLSVEEIENLK